MTITFPSIPALRADEPAYIETLTPDLLGYIFTYTESNAAESFVSQQFYQASRTELVCKYFFSELHSIVGEDYSDDFNSLIGRQKSDTWFAINKKAIKYFKNLRKLTGLSPIVLPKLNEDYYSTNLVSIYREGYQDAVDQNLVAFCGTIPLNLFKDNSYIYSLLEENRHFQEDAFFKPRCTPLKNKKTPFSLRELATVLREYLKKNNTSLEKNHNLAHEKLTLVPPEVCEFTVLKSLCFNYNPLRTLPKCFSKLVNLTKLRLDLDQNLEKFPSPLLTLSSLKTLELWAAKGIKFPKTFGNLAALTKFRLCCKTLQILPRSFSSLENLTILDLTYCPIKDVPYPLFHLSKLRTLIFAVNPKVNHVIKQKNPMNFSESFDRLTNLTTLSLEGYPNPPESLGSLTNLTELNLASTKLEVLPTWIFKLTNLKKLNIKDTPLYGGNPSSQLLSSLHGRLPNLECTERWRSHK